MPTLIKNPSAGDGLTPDRFLVVEGGLGGVTPEVSLKNIGGFSEDEIGKVNGPIPLSYDKTISSQYLQGLNDNAISAVGPSRVRCGTENVYQILSYDSYVDLSASTDLGEVQVVNGSVIYLSPSTEGPCGFWVTDQLNTTFVKVTAYEGIIEKPVIISPEENFVPAEGILTIRGSNFSSNDTGAIVETFSSADFEISFHEDFSTLIHANYNVQSTTTTFSNYEYQQPSYVRIRYHGTERTSEWSDTRRIEARIPHIETPVIATPTFGETEVGFSNPVDQAKIKLSSLIQFSAFKALYVNDTLKSTDVEISTTPDFTTTVASVYNDTTLTQDWNTGYVLDYGTTYYARVRRQGHQLISSWSDPVSFTTKIDTRSIDKPTIVANGVDANALQLEWTLTLDTIKFNNYTDFSSEVRWEISTTPDFSTILHSLVSPGVLLKDILLNYSTTYYARARVVGGVKTSPMSNVYTFSTKADDRAIIPPVLTVNGPSPTEIRPVLAGTAFATENYLDTHLSTDWQIATDANFTNVISSVTNSTTNKTGWTCTVDLAQATGYYARARYKSNTRTSDWSSSLYFVVMPELISDTYYFHVDTGAPNVNQPDSIPSDQFFRIKKIGSTFYVDISLATRQWAKWTGATIYSAVTYDPNNASDGWRIYINLLEASGSGCRVRGQCDVFGGYSGTFDIYVPFVSDGVPATPAVSVNGGSSNRPLNPSFTGSAFSQPGAYSAHHATDWRVATDAAFTNVIKSSTNDSTNKTTWSTSGLSYSRTYYVRCRYRSRYTVSNWSNSVAFTTMADPKPAPPIILTFDYTGNGFTFYTDPAVTQVYIKCISEDGWFQWEIIRQAGPAVSSTTGVRLLPNGNGYSDSSNYVFNTRGDAFIYMTVYKDGYWSDQAVHKVIFPNSSGPGH